MPLLNGHSSGYQLYLNQQKGQPKLLTSGEVCLLPPLLSFFLLNFIRFWFDEEEENIHFQEQQNADHTLFLL